METDKTSVQDQKAPAKTQIPQDNAYFAEKINCIYPQMDPEKQWPFVEEIYRELRSGIEEGNINESSLDETLIGLLNNPYRWFLKTCKKPAFRPKHFTLVKPVLRKAAEIEDPLVSVIIPCYNNGNYIPATIESLHRQTLRNFEVICIDDGSQDNTLDILMELAKADPRISVLSKFNTGQGHTRNTGLEYASGKYIQFLDSDDMLDEETLEFMTYFAETWQTDVSFYDGSSFFESEALKQQYSRYLSAYEFPLLIETPITGKQYLVLQWEHRKNRVTSCMSVYRKDFLLKNDICFPEGVLHEDNLFMLRCLKNAGRVNHTPRQFYKRRIHENSTMTGAVTFEHFYGYFECALEYLDEIRAEKDPACCDALNNAINLNMNNVRSTYRKIGDKDAVKSKLTPYEWSIFNQVVLVPRREAEKARKKPDGETQQAVELVYASASYRLGNKLLKPLSMIKKLIRPN